MASSLAQVDVTHRPASGLLDHQVAADDGEAGVGAVVADVQHAVDVSDDVLDDEALLVAEPQWRATSALSARASLIAARRSAGVRPRSGDWLEVGVTAAGAACAGAITARGLITRAAIPATPSPRGARFTQVPFILVRASGSPCPDDV